MNASPRRACVSVDLDASWCYREIHGLARDETGGPDAAYTVGVRRMLDFFDSVGIRATLFVIGSDLVVPAHLDLLEEAVERGHELGNHSWAHDYALRTRGVAGVRDDLRRAHDAIGEVTGSRPRGFRTPGYNVSPTILSVVAELDYLYDSSVFPCPPYYLAKAAIMAWRKLRGRPSRSAMTRPETMVAPITPYRPDPTWVARRSDSRRMPLEIPMCVVPGVRFPVIGTSLHLLGRRGFDAVYPLLRGVHRRLVNLEMHAIDFMDARDPSMDVLVSVQPDLRVPWTDKRAIYSHVFERLRADYRFEPLVAAATAW